MLPCRPFIVGRWPNESEARAGEPIRIKPEGGIAQAPRGILSSFHHLETARRVAGSALLGQQRSAGWPRSRA
ncbi:MAG: hypothetical protein ACI8X5_000400 [Planctomycetota bacterium]|jgi:hypothetical protein